MAWMWLGVTLACIVVEMVTSGIFFILFAVGALLAFLYSLFAGILVVQVIIFAVVTMLCLLFLRPLVRRWLKLGKYGTAQGRPDYIDQNIGREGIVVREITSAVKGQVKIGSEVWTACGVDTQSIANGERVRVIRIEGVTAVVEPLSSS
jgi:membrane protein implicated in regulation of membrane protease activity